MSEHNIPLYVNKLTSYPFASQLKVTDKNGDEIAISTVMLTCKKKYETLQGVTVDIVRELDAYALLQKVLAQPISYISFLSQSFDSLSYPQLINPRD